MRTGKKRFCPTEGEKGVKKQEEEK